MTLPVQMSSVTQATDRPRVVAAAGATVLALLCATKFLAIYVATGFVLVESPIVFLGFAAVLLAGAVLTALSRRAGPYVLALLGLGLTTLFAVALVTWVRGEPSDLWSDQLLVYAGTPVAVIVVAAAGTVIFRGRRGSA